MSVWMCVCFYVCVTVDIGEVLWYLKPLKLIHLVCLLHLLFTNNGIRAKTQTKKAKNINHLCNLAKYLKNKILDLRLSLKCGVFTLCLFVYVFCVCLGLVMAPTKYLENKILDLRLLFNSGVFMLCFYV